MQFVKNLLKNTFFRMHKTELGSRASILSYHDVGTSGAFFTVSPSSLKRQFEYIKQQNICVVSLMELLTRLREGKDISGCVALTFNDGYKSFYTEVFPLLKKHNLPVTLFISVEFLDTSIQTSDGHVFQTLTPDELQETLASGLVECMPRAAHRQSLDNIVFEQAVEHIEGARKNIEALTGKDAPIFAYAKGSPTEKIAQHMKENNWLGAVTSDEGLVHPHTDPFSLPRNSVNRHTTFTQFKGKLSGAIEEYIEARKRRRNA